MATSSILSGQVVSNILVAAGDSVLVNKGGVVIGATVQATATLSAATGAVLSGAFVNSGTMTGGTLVGPGTQEIVAVGATAVNQTIGQGATISCNGHVTNVQISGGTLAMTSTGPYDNYSFAANAGGTLTISSGNLNGSKAGLELTSGRTINITGGGLYLSGSVGTGGTLNLGGYGAVGLTVDGGTVNWTADASTDSMPTFTSNGGVVNVYQGANIIQSFSGTVNPYGTVNVQSGVSVMLVSVGANANLRLLPGSTLKASVTVLSGGTVTLDSGVVGDRRFIDTSAGNASLVLNGLPMPDVVIQGWTYGNTVTLKGVPKSSVLRVVPSTNGVDIVTTTGTYTLNIYMANSLGYALVDDGAGNLVYTTCFARGTLIRTPEGEIAVEALEIGQLVSTPKGSMPVRWLGQNSLNVLDQPSPEQEWLVRICAGALGDGIPKRDLLVTQEHCLVFEGKMVPARMLVNGVSVLLDRTIEVYDYYHVGLDSHEPVWAEGALTESYLDTGNRAQFAQQHGTADGSAVIDVTPALAIDTSRAFVEPIHAAIAQRAGATPRHVETTDDPALHLVSEHGAVIYPSGIRNSMYMFLIPGNVQRLRLASRAARPCDVVGPFIDDRRELGVLVHRITLWEEMMDREIEAPFEQARLAGWHGLEQGHHRWTNGSAFIELEPSALPRTLHVSILAGGPYAIAQDGPLPGFDLDTANDNLTLVYSEQMQH